MNVIKINESLREEYKRTHSGEVFRKYVMSELLAPIVDIDNALALIRSRYSKVLDYELIVVGSYLIIQFSSEENEMLSILNSMCKFLPKEQQSIVLYLNALQIEKTDKKYMKSLLYKQYLCKSCELCDQYVNTYYRLAEISKEEERKLFFEYAKRNIKRSYTVDDINKLDIEHFLDPAQYINEFITGTIENII